MHAVMKHVAAHSVIGSFAGRLLAHDLPELATSRRADAVTFIAHRIDSLPSFTRFGVLTIGTVFRGLIALPGGWTIAKLLIRLPLPIVNEYPRLIRSLGFAYVWETWPTTAPSGLAR